MVTLTTPNAGQALIALDKAMRHALQRHNDMQNCRTCDRQVAEQWRRDAEFFANLIVQIERQIVRQQ